MSTVSRCNVKRKPLRKIKPKLKLLRKRRVKLWRSRCMLSLPLGCKIFRELKERQSILERNPRDVVTFWVI